jgi:mRNA interferase RelE/StbE
MRYTLEFTASAAREFKKLERAVQRRIAPRIDELVKDPIPPGAKKLRGDPDHYRIRVGDYRIIYRIDGNGVAIVVVKIGHQREVYR